MRGFDIHEGLPEAPMAWSFDQARQSGNDGSGYGLRQPGMVILSKPIRDKLFIESVSGRSGKLAVSAALASLRDDGIPATGGNDACRRD